MTSVQIIHRWELLSDRGDRIEPSRLRTGLSSSPQQGKHRTNSWKGSPASSGGSIWSRGFTPAPPLQAAASPLRPPPTRGQERVISVDRLLQVKRPREGELT